MGDAVISDAGIARYRRRLIVIAIGLAAQVAATVYGYLPLAKVRFRNMTGAEAPGLYVGNEWFAWQVVRYGSFAGLWSNATRFRFLGIDCARLSPSFWFVRINVLWTILPTLAFGAIEGGRLLRTTRAKRATDPAFDRGFAIDCVEIANCPSCGQRLPSSGNRPRDVESRSIVL